MLYRIYTEDVKRNRKAVEREISAAYPGFTLTKGQGFWRLQKENSLIVEIVAPHSADQKVLRLARRIKTVNHQEAVLVQRIRNCQWIV